MRSPATRSPSTSRVGASPPNALGQVLPPDFHGDLVRGSLLPAAAFRLPRRRAGPDIAGALQAHGAPALLGDHDAGGRSDDLVRRLVVARLVPRSCELVSCQSRAGCASRGVPPLVLAADA